MKKLSAFGVAFASVFFGMTVVTTPSVSDTPMADVDGELVYRIMRKGADIGRHSFVYRSQPDGSVAVDVDARIRVKVAFVTAYKMDHSASELWVDGQLQSLVSTTRRAGKDWDIKAEAADDSLSVWVNGDFREAPRASVPSSFSLAHDLFGDQALDVDVIDILEGRQSQIRVEPAGYQVIEHNGEEVNARYYELSEGDRVSHRFWLNDKDEVLRLSYMSKAGGFIEYIREYATGTIPTA